MEPKDPYPVMRSIAQPLAAKDNGFFDCAACGCSAQNDRENFTLSVPPAGIFLVPARKIGQNRLRGSDSTAASGGRREGSEWQRSKFRERIANKKFWVPQQDGTDREAYRRILLFVPCYPGFKPSSLRTLPAPVVTLLQDDF